MFTIDMSRCPGCPAKESCTTRTKLVQTLNPLAVELSTDPQYLAAPADGLIIVACHGGM